MIVSLQNLPTPPTSLSPSWGLALVVLLLAAAVAYLYYQVQPLLNAPKSPSQTRQRKNLPPTHRTSNSPLEQQVETLTTQMKQLVQVATNLNTKIEALEKRLAALESQCSNLTVLPTAQPATQTAAQPTVATQSYYYIDRLPTRQDGNLSTEAGDETYFRVSEKGVLELRPGLSEEACRQFLNTDIPLFKKEGSGSRIASRTPGKVKINTTTMKWELLEPLTLQLNS